MIKRFTLFWICSFLALGLFYTFFITNFAEYPFHIVTIMKRVILTPRSLFFLTVICSLPFFIHNTLQLLHLKSRVLCGFFTLIIICVLFPIIKNTVLYFSYQHSRSGFLKVNKQTYSEIYDTMECAFDERHKEIYIFTSDTSGYKEYTFYSNGAHIYSWASLIPFDSQQQPRIIPFSLDSQFIRFHLDDSTYSYSKYLIRGDTLFVDSFKDNVKYAQEFAWSFRNTYDPKFIIVFEFWNDWVDIPRVIGNVIASYGH